MLMRTRLTLQRAPPFSPLKAATRRGSIRPFARKRHRTLHSKYVLRFSPPIIHLLTSHFNPDPFDPEPSRDSPLEIHQIRLLPFRKQGPPSRRPPPPTPDFTSLLAVPGEAEMTFHYPEIGQGERLHGRCLNYLRPCHQTREWKGKWLWIAQPQC